MRTRSACSLSITGEIIANDTAANLKATLAGDRIAITVDWRLCVLPHRLWLPVGAES